MSKLKSYQEQVQKFLDHGIDTAEKRHKRMVTRPFDFAEKLEKEAKSYSFKSVRQAHNHYAKSVYSSLRGLNSRANSFASELIARFEKDASDSARKTATAPDQRAATRRTNTRKASTAKKSSAAQGSSSQSSTASA